MNQRNYFNDLFYDRKKVSMALAVITAAILMVAFLVFGGQDTDQQESLNQTTSQQQDNTPEENTQSDTTTQTPQSSQDTTSSEDQQVQEDDEPATDSGITEISYTANGFVPKNITVEAGTTVHFVNNSGQTMRAESISESNSTQTYMFFQQPSTLSTGERYVFVFNDPGTLVYHNLNNSRHTGTIVVVE